MASDSLPIDSCQGQSVAGVISRSSWKLLGLILAGKHDMPIPLVRGPLGTSHPKIPSFSSKTQFDPKLMPLDVEKHYFWGA